MCAVVTSAGGGCGLNGMAERSTSSCVREILARAPTAPPPARTSSGGSAVTSTIVEGGPPGAGPAVEQQVETATPPRRLDASGSAVAGAPDRLALVAVISPPSRAGESARHDRVGHAHADETRCPLCTAGARLSSALTSSVSGPGQKRSRQRARARREPPRLRRRRLVGTRSSGMARSAGAPLDGEQAGHGARITRIDAEPVQRVGGIRDDAARRG